MYGDKRDYPKIDLYVRNKENGIFEYVGSSTWAKTCKEAKARYLANTGKPIRDVKAFFAL